jgi:hypothetical protein
MATCGQHSSAFSPTKLATSVLDHDTGLSLEYKQLHTHPKLGPIWSKSYANELGRLCQGVGTNNSGTNKCIQGTDRFYIIDHKDIPTNRCKEITYSKVVYKVRPEKLTQTAPASPLAVIASAILAMLAPRRPLSRLSN